MPSEGSSRKAVVSQFFTKPSSSSQKKAAVGSSSTSSSSPAVRKDRTSLKKQTSIISLSSSDGVDDLDDDIQIIDAVSTSNKRKASTTINSSSSFSALLHQVNNNANNSEAPNKKVKVAPLFERVKNAGVVSSPAVKKEEDAALSQRLSQWKFAAAGDQRNGTPPAAAGGATTGHTNDSDVETYASASSSPLPEVGKSNEAVLARRAHVRKMLLGINTEWRRPPDEEETAMSVDQDDAVVNDEDDAASHDQPMPSTSKLHSKTTAPDLSQFASSTTTKSKAKKGKAIIADKKGKSKATEPEGIKYTPLEQQVLEIRKQYPDVILIVEVGYKFKFFGEDAKIAARELNIACFMSQNFYTAMIPSHRLQVHIKRLISSGYKVGVVRQKETAALKKIGDNRNAPFTRELTDLYTASTYIGGLDDDNVGESTPTFGTILCICEESRGGKGSDEKVRFGLVSAQPSTGEVIYDQFEDNFLRAELETRLLHIQPGELVLQGDVSAPTRRVISYLLTQEGLSSGQGQGRLSESRRTLTRTDAIATLTEFYSKEPREQAPPSSPSKAKKKKKSRKSTTSDHGASTDTAIDLSDSESVTVPPGEALASVLGLPSRVIVALAGLVMHLSEFKLESVFLRPQFFTPFAQRSHMLLNSNTIANLEIFRNQTDFKQTSSLFSILDHTKTAFGQRLLRRWVAMPLMQKEALQTRIDAVDEIITSSSFLLGKVRGLLKGLPDLERGLARIHYGKSTPLELLRVLEAFERIGNEFHNLPQDLSRSTVGFKSSTINDAFYALPRVKPLVEQFISKLNKVKMREGSKADMWLGDHEPEELTDCKDVLDTVEAEFQNHLKECRKLLRKPAIDYITVAQDEYLLEVRISESKVVPDDWIRVNGTKTVYRYRSPRMQALLQERDQATEHLAAEADYAFSKLLNSISAEYEGFREVVVRLAALDCLISLAATGLEHGYVKPVLVDDQFLEIKAGRHPVVERVMERPFIPNDVSFTPQGLRAMVITGCNMSGKSSVSRMVALLVIMAQIGCRIPCDSAKIGIVDYIGTRFGANDEIARGRSTFMVELTETCEIIKAATPRSLVVLDELGRGTSTNDGLAIAYAVLRYLIQKIKATTLFITHFPQLSELSKKYPEACAVYQMAYTEQMGIDRVPDITFLYKLVPGLTDRVHGVACARMAGVPESICVLAAEKSQELEESDQHLQAGKQAVKGRRLLELLSSSKGSDEDVLQAAGSAFVA